MRFPADTEQVKPVRRRTLAVYFG